MLAKLLSPNPPPTLRLRKRSPQWKLCLRRLVPWRPFRAYPGEAMMTALKDALGRSDYSSFSRITNRIAKAIITGSYRRSANAWKVGEEGEKEGNDRLMKDYFDTGDLTKPYFEVLIVSDDPSSGTGAPGTC